MSSLVGHHFALAGRDFIKVAQEHIRSEVDRLVMVDLDAPQIEEGARAYVSWRTCLAFAHLQNAPVEIAVRYFASDEWTAKHRASFEYGFTAAWLNDDHS